MFWVNGDVVNGDVVNRAEAAPSLMGYASSIGMWCASLVRWLINCTCHNISLHSASVLYRRCRERCFVVS